jgi:hypothetical protein
LKFLPKSLGGVKGVVSYPPHPLTPPVCIYDFGVHKYQTFENHMLYTKVIILKGLTVTDQKYFKSLFIVE